MNRIVGFKYGGRKSVQLPSSIPKFSLFPRDTYKPIQKFQFAFNGAKLYRNDYFATQKYFYSTKKPPTDEDDLRELRRIEQSVLSEFKERRREEKTETENENDLDIEEAKHQREKQKELENLRKVKEMVMNTRDYVVEDEEGDKIDLTRIRKRLADYEVETDTKPTAEEEFYERCVEALKKRDKQLLEAGETTKGILRLKRWRLHLLNYFQKIEATFQQIKDIEILDATTEKLRYDNAEIAQREPTPTSNRVNKEKAKIAESIKVMTKDLQELQRKFGTVTLKNQSDLETARRQFYPQNAPYSVSNPPLVADLKEELYRWVNAEKKNAKEFNLEKADVAELPSRQLYEYLERVVTEHFYPRRVEYETEYSWHMPVYEDDEIKSDLNPKTFDLFLDELYRPERRTKYKEYEGLPTEHDEQLDEDPKLLSYLKRTGDVVETSEGYRLAEDEEEERIAAAEELSEKTKKEKITPPKVKETPKQYAEDEFARTGIVKEEKDEEEDVFKASRRIKGKIEDEQEEDDRERTPILALREKILLSAKRGNLDDYYAHIRSYSGSLSGDEITRSSGYPKIIPSLRSVKLYHEKYGRHFLDDEEIIFSSIEGVDHFVSRLKDFIELKKQIYEPIIHSVVIDAIQIAGGAAYPVESKEDHDFHEACLGYQGGRFLQPNDPQNLIGAFSNFIRNEKSAYRPEDLLEMYTETEIKFFKALKSESDIREKERQATINDNMLAEFDHELTSFWDVLRGSVSRVLKLEETTPSLTKFSEDEKKSIYDDLMKLTDQLSESDVIRGKITADAWKHEKFYPNEEKKAVLEGNVSTLIPEREGDELVKFRLIEHSIHALDFVRAGHRSVLRNGDSKINSIPYIRALPFDDADRKSYGAGYRKSAAAYVKLRKGTGIITINRKPFLKYFPHIVHRCAVLAPLVAVERLNYFDIDISVKGGGFHGQSDAIKLGLSRALENYNREFHPILRFTGLGRRDVRVVERKKPGKKKARKSFQWVKR